jgi:hypothetical protein
MGFIQIPQRKRIRIRLNNTKRLREARRKHKNWLREKGLDNLKPKDTSSDYVFPTVEDRTGVPLGNKIPVMTPGVGSKKEPMTYSGKRKLIGIATMHKSNQVPVFADDDTEGRDKATEISQMRRN